MLQIKVAAKHAVDPEKDELGRRACGYSDDMTEREVYEAARGCWVIGERADREHYALVAHGGIIRMAIKINKVVTTTIRESSDSRDNRRAIEGEILRRGNPVYNAYVGKPSPVGPVRNPITYFPSKVGWVPCRCGCGKSVELGEFITGHDQTALHERVKQIGTVAEFLDWFDRPWRKEAQSA